MLSLFVIKYFKGTCSECQKMNQKPKPWLIPNEPMTSHLRHCARKSNISKH